MISIGASTAGKLPAGWQQDSMSGFTLLELMITIALVSIMIGIAIPSFRDITETQTLRAAAGSLHASLMQARAEAIKRNAEVRLRPASGQAWSDGWLIPGLASPSSDTSPIHHERLSGGVTVSATGGGSAVTSIIFRPSGRLKPASSSVQDIAFELVSTGGTSKKRCVRIALDGRATTKSGGC